MEKKVLIIEDEKEICLLLQKLLVNDSNAVECAFSLNEGIEKVSSLKPDVVLLDNNLPDGQGVDYINKFKNGANRKVIMISAMHNLREKAIEAGVDWFIEKPINIMTIRNLLK
ncbi:response regulator [Cytophagaceae bacterium DM2B3-1]|uniref:Response regulator n=1 Tax=Xanthocytophaga flava TaxID=3048013 RepID=A0AAE3QMG0_9BACT|nr:response regulator [Xanthocytophaga flavus]MDJ1472293.1 response regulator [Xanthocytophaga flavus]MDJ1482052.1 response regulator [Xanthocytophaga flavus]MDJ1492304.1 response regulator [Xanthocytophaga flavus]